MKLTKFIVTLQIPVFSWDRTQRHLSVACVTKIQDYVFKYVKRHLAMKYILMACTQSHPNLCHFFSNNRDYLRFKMLDRRPLGFSCFQCASIIMLMRWNSFVTIPSSGPKTREKNF